jgi:hypothetical protein
MNEGRDGGGGLLYVELSIEDAALPLAGFGDANPDTALRVEFQSTVDGGWEDAFVACDGADVGAVETGLSTDPTVSQWASLGPIGDEHHLRVRFRDGVTPFPPEITEFGVRLASARYRNGAWSVRMHVPSRPALYRVMEYYHDNGITFRVRRLHIARRTELGVESALSAGQYELLVVAYRNGYFEVPREVSQGELAVKLGISRSGVSQRLRRSIARLVEATLVP